MAKGKGIRIALLGAGIIGRELIRRTLNNPDCSYIAVGDTSGVIANTDGFDGKELMDIVRLKEGGGHIKDYTAKYEYYESPSSVFNGCDLDALVDVTDAQTYDILMEALNSPDEQMYSNTCSSFSNSSESFGGSLIA